MGNLGYLYPFNLILCGAEFGELRACFFLCGVDLVLCGARFGVLRACFFLCGVDLVLCGARFGVLRACFLLCRCGLSPLWSGGRIKSHVSYFVAELFLFLGKGGAWRRCVIKSRKVVFRCRAFFFSLAKGRVGKFGV